MEGNLSHNVDLGPSFYFMKYRIFYITENVKKLPVSFFYIKQKLGDMLPSKRNLKIAHSKFQFNNVNSD